MLLEGRSQPVTLPGASLPRWIDAEAVVVANALLPGKAHHYAVLEMPDHFPELRGGEFAMLSPFPASSATLLRRPMSVARAWREAGRLFLGFLYTVVGEGTRALAAAGERWSVLGPLGRGFPLTTPGPKILVAGGRGVAPLVILAEECARRGEPVVFLNGARSERELVSPREMGADALAPGSIVLESTEDGSRGWKGRVLDLLDEPTVAHLLREPGVTFYSCGPHGLLAAVGEVARALGAPAWVSIEAHMACGTGICRSCVVARAPGLPVPAGASNAGYVLSCLDGPVVEASAIDWEKAL